MKKVLVVFILGFMMISLNVSNVLAVGTVSEEMDQNEMMMKMKEATSPGAEHAIFQMLEGKWEYTSRFWMTPGTEPQESTGTSNHTLIYGGRFLQQEVQGEWMGEAFLGTSLLGYDKIRKEYNNIWYDNMSTGIMLATGHFDAETKTLHLSGTFSCPMTGETHKNHRMEYILTDNNQNTYVGYDVDAEGNEFKSMEIVYTRVS